MLNPRRQHDALSDVLIEKCMRWPKTDTILFDGGQHSGTMTDTVLAGWRTVCPSRRNPVRHAQHPVTG